MSKRKYFFYLGLLFLLLFLLGGCDFIKERPILDIPDANKDRMKKELFIGTKDKPKFWITKSTLIRTTFDQGFPGRQSRVYVGYFEFSRDKLKFYDPITRQFLETPEKAKQGIPELIHEWGIEHSEYRLKEVDGYTSNQEEENPYLPWHQKSFFTIKWNSLEIKSSSSSCWQPGKVSVIDSSREITEDYISYVLSVNYHYTYDRKKCRAYYQKVHTEEYRYSFKRVDNPLLTDENYEPYKYTGENDPLFNKYGYFTTVRPVIAQDNRDKNVFYANRWNPHKKHIFYFGENYPSEYEYIAHGVICATNKLFAKHKLNDYPTDGKCTVDGSVLPAKNETCSKGICFELRKNTGQKMGDIRYSFFHILSPTQYYYLGYGPSDAHPATGEIVGGNIYINFSLLETFIDYFYNNPLKRELFIWTEKDGTIIENSHGNNKYDTSSLFSHFKNLLEEEDPEKWTKSAKEISAQSPIREDFEYLVQGLTHGDPYWSQWTRSQTSNSPATNKPMDIVSRLVTQISEEGNFSDRIDLEKLKELNHQAHHSSFEYDHIIRNSVFPYQEEKNHLTTRYPIEHLISQISFLLADGRSVQEVKEIILFQLFSHEFGHVLTLRHNFYGSVDARHWHPELDSSSVMDYISIKKKAVASAKAFFGPYDEAALVYAYSDGKTDLAKKNKTQYLFCSEENTRINFLCNRWDYGQTPSEVMMSLIENYEELYFTLNFRLDRAYWDTRGYPYYILQTMMNIKQALLMWQTTFNTNHILEELNKSKKDYTDSEKANILDKTEKDIKQAIKLSMAFYNSVIQIPASDRHWLDGYNKRGEIERIGIFFDKLFALIFLMGDASFTYNPNFYLGKAAYTTYINELGFRDMIEKIMENTLTWRVDMTPWFIDLGRWLYAKSSSNFYSRYEGLTLLDKIAVRCYTPESLQSQLGIDPRSIERDKSLIVLKENLLDKIKDPYYKELNGHLGIVYREDGNYYVSSNILNKYSFVLFKQLESELHGGMSRELLLDDIHEMFYFYNWFKNANTSPNCL